MTKAALVVVFTSSAPLLAHRFAIERDRTTVGRSEDCDVVLDVDGVLDTHACIVRGRAGTWEIEGLGLDVTIEVDGRTVRWGVLRGGSTLRLGQVTLRFLAGANLEAQYHEEIYRLTIIDPLTEIYNKRYFSEATAREVIRARRGRTGLAVVVLNVAGFRAYNDANGNRAGDEALRAVSRALKAQLSPERMLARIGGDELAVLVQGAALSDANELARRLTRAAPSGLALRAGVAALEDGDPSAEALIERARARVRGDRERRGTSSS